MKAIFKSIEGLIDRRILVNFVADPAIVSNLLPEPFRPQLYKGNAVVGICLIRLRQIRPTGWPSWMGVSSENAAHRFAVEWEEDAVVKTGVYIPRRDSSTLINHLAAGRIFPGQHRWSGFEVKEADGHYALQIKHGKEDILDLSASLSKKWPADSVFNDLETASDFFRCGDCGYSPSSGRLDGVQLCINNWQANFLQIDQIASGFFSDESRFPPGSIRLDHALLMTNIKHQWKLIEPIKKAEPLQSGSLASNGVS